VWLQDVLVKDKRFGVWSVGRSWRDVPQDDVMLAQATGSEQTCLTLRRKKAFMGSKKVSFGTMVRSEQPGSSHGTKKRLS
jgi:predicted NUDIX family NTP pyrophosphohydrolase